MKQKSGGMHVSISLWDRHDQCITCPFEAQFLLLWGHGFNCSLLFRVYCFKVPVSQIHLPAGVRTRVPLQYYKTRKGVWEERKEGLGRGRTSWAQWRKEGGSSVSDSLTACHDLGGGFLQERWLRFFWNFYFHPVKSSTLFLSFSLSFTSIFFKKIT